MLILLAGLTALHAGAQRTPETPLKVEPIIEHGTGPTPGGAPATPGGNAAPVTAAPTVMQVVPSQLQTGHSYELALTGVNFRSGMQVGFGSGITVVRGVTVTDPNHALVNVQVAPEALPGEHVVTVSLARPATFAPQAPLTSQGPGYVVVGAAPPATGAVILNGVLPAQVAQGQSATLTLTGTGFYAGMAVSFGPGITAGGPVQVTSPTQATLAIQVSPQAPPILRHPALIAAGHAVEVAPGAALTVAARVQLPVAAPLLNLPVVLATSPARLFTGQSYSVTLRGMNFVPQMQVDLGAGVNIVGGIRVQSASEAVVQVDVQGDAPEGMRWVGMQLATGGTALRQGTSVFVQAAPPVLRSAVHPPVDAGCAQPQVRHHGTIVLDGPLFVDQGGDAPVISVPVLTDQTVFAWHEANVGLAQRVELRFYQGGAMIASRSLSAQSGQALPHSLAADPGLIAELTSKVSGRVPKLQGGAQLAQSNPAITWDLTWQVVGFHSYSQSCVIAAPVSLEVNTRSAAGMKEIVVEQSTAVPITQPVNGAPLLDLPAAPTGMACGGSAPAGNFRMRAPRGGGAGGSGASPPSSTLTLIDQSTTSQGNGATATAGFVGDVWQIGGSFNWSNSPWTLSSQTTIFPLGVPSGNGVTLQQINSETLQNIIVDWGDGTVGPMTATFNTGLPWPTGNVGNLITTGNTAQQGTVSSLNVSNVLNPGGFSHAYGQTGSYTVRVYMLPESQVQQVLPGSVHMGGGGMYGRMVSGMQSVRSGAAQQASNDAYQFMCLPVNIQHRTDPASIGPLQVVAVSITGFPGDNAPSVPGSLSTPIMTAAQFERRSALAQAPPSGVKVRSLPGGGGASNTAAAGPQFTSCDVSLIGGAAVQFYGQGTVRLTWYLDGVAVGSSEEPLGPSTSRTDAQLAHNPPLVGPVLTTQSGFESAPLNLVQQTIGQHQLMVSAEAVQDAHPVQRALAAAGLLEAATGLDSAAGAGAGGGAPAAAAPVAVRGAALLAGAPPLALLGPPGAAKAGLPALAWLGNAPAGALGIGMATNPFVGNGGNPPGVVSSPPAPYQVTSANPALPCTFRFPVEGGSFIVAGLQQGGKPTVKQQGSQYSGTGTLLTAFADASATATQTIPVPIPIQGWTMQADNVTVATGSFSTRPALTPMHLPGVTGSLTQIAGKSGSKVTATLTAAIANGDIQAINGSPPPAWTGLASTLSPQGDWYASGLPIPPLLVYDSGYTLKAANATLDLSGSQGQGADSSCSGSAGKAWMGVLLNNATLSAYDFHLPNAPTAAANDWALDSYGFCGQASFGAANFPVEKGSLSWSGISASASFGGFTAIYNGLKVHVPWLNVDLGSASGTTRLAAGAGNGPGAIALNLDSPSTVTVSDGPVTLTAANLSFAAIPKAGGWAVRSNTSVSFQSPQGSFASGVALNGLDFGMDGAAHLDDGTSARHLSLSGQNGNIGGAVVNLKSVDVQVPPSSSATRLAFAFDSTLTLSKNPILPAKDVSVTYTVTQPLGSNNYVGAGPGISPFSFDLDYPSSANPTTHLHITPQLSAAGSGGGSKGGGGGSNTGVLFSGALDMGMFGGPPVSGQFVLGYIGSDDYWIAKVVADLGPGISLAPIPLSIFQIGGGLGYNVTPGSFASSNVSQATPVDDGTLVFDASLLLGTSDHVTFGVNGNFIIKPGGQDAGGDMDYQAWILNPDWSGKSPIYGSLSFGSGGFDGTLNAQFSMLDNQVSLQAINNAVHMHFDSSQWYVHLGTQQNPVQGQVFIAKGDAWADLGSSGFALGVMAYVDPSAGDCNSLCAYVHDNWLLQAAITPQPLAVSASAQSSLNVGACAMGFCLSSSQSVGVQMSLPPPYLDFSYGLSVCPPGYLNANLQVLPSLQPSVGGGFCV